MTKHRDDRGLVRPKKPETMDECIFCKIVLGQAPRDLVCDMPNSIAIRPLDPVTNGHTLVLPKRHVGNYTEEPILTGKVMQEAAELAPHIHRQSNLITSQGSWATQTVFHLHVHIIPRRPNDGLHLPWTGQVKS